MPVCVGCGGSYINDFRFCPYCGRPQPESSLVNVVVHSAPAKFDEGVLRLTYTGKSEDQLVDNGKRGMFGIGWKDARVYVLFFVFDLKVSPISGQHSIGLVSSTFRGAFYDMDAHVVQVLKKEYEYYGHTSKWYEKYRTEIEMIWSQFNDLLVSEGWNGVTERAIERRLPEFLEHGHSSWVNAASNVFTEKEQFADQAPNESRAIEIGAYRYRRIAQS